MVTEPAPLNPPTGFRTFGRMGHFQPRLFRFFRELSANNDREWFGQHRHEYETYVREPARRFISDLAGPLAEVSPHFVADPSKVGGSLLRIQRDIRFSPDKTPYRTYLGIHLRHENWQERHCPSIYLALQPKGSYIGLGSWRPDAKTARAIRLAIVERPDEWKAATADLRLAGDSLKRPPRGFDPHHELIADLERKDFAVSERFTQSEVTSDDFVERVMVRCRASAPLLGFLCRAVGVSF